VLAHRVARWQRHRADDRLNRSRRALADVVVTALRKEQPR